ncbi:tRNA uridine-5-carboxymethylaminomethyl(34) synthesis GTPase MnmE [Porticoccus sp. W117]|uniref:tRNA uridine-5-carboxymethylaminomethyl(34) synthesis GTPase MnmE n=1 Tax=Porticoccus sp. W117 TaxID=3054777 RepID=UPI0025986753|nr:tRNA uridine-5-carboxymethylaminomethyl(34) synthesis GTPase MnmE [Porticoccus sp. W117]MDM3870777.1 tRNA uridine-5-carboxymethylaminomethyl(34) synthesis GTPase MnmE [Porticoccus sp. W117]
MTDQFTNFNTDTIAAVATAPGRGGVGIIRISGPRTRDIAERVVGNVPQQRLATFARFKGADGVVIDEGVALFFPGPNSFTGEDVLELQGHGGPVILDALLNNLCQIGARPARPGEFSERAFLNDKLDLAQAEAIADLIDASSEQAARCALRSLQGEFSQQVHTLTESLIQLRIYVEAAIDFPEEEIDFLADSKVGQDLQSLLDQLATIFAQAQQGALIQEGMTVVIAGKPNAGKSSLLNALSGKDSAIVTDIEGTTRDVLRERIHIDGMPLHVIDTAGLRDSEDAVEQEGIRRAWKEIDRADRILFVIDSSKDYSLDAKANWPDYFARHPERDNITFVLNKVDISGIGTEASEDQGHPVIRLSARQGQGIDALTGHLKQCMGFAGVGEGSFTARRRHIVALEKAQEFMLNGQQQLNQAAAGELLAEDLRQAQQALGEITGAFTSDDLLGRIFSSFCIGK